MRVATEFHLKQIQGEFGTPFCMQYAYKGFLIVHLLQPDGWAHSPESDSRDSKHFLVI